MDINSLVLPEERKKGDEAYVSPVNAELQSGIEAQQTIGENIVSGFKATALYAGYRRQSDERQAATAQYRTENPDAPANTAAEQQAGNSAALKGLFGGSHDSGKAWVKSDADTKQLLEGIPYQHQDDIMEAPTLDAATRVRARIMEDLGRQQRSAAQWDGGGFELMGSLIDVDAPLMIMSGGMIGAAKTAQIAARLSKNKRFVGGVQGTSGGLQAGAAVGTYDALVRETAGEAEFVAAVIGGAALGNVFGTLGGPVQKSLNDLEADYARRMETEDPSIVANTDTAMGDSPSEAFVVPERRPATEMESTAVVTPLDPTAQVPVREGTTFTPDAVEPARPRETTIAPDHAEGQAKQNRPCMLGD